MGTGRLLKGAVFLEVTHPKKVPRSTPLAEEAATTQKASSTKILVRATEPMPTARRMAISRICSWMLASMDDDKEKKEMSMATTSVKPKNTHISTSTMSNTVCACRSSHSVAFSPSDAEAAVMRATTWSMSAEEALLCGLISSRDSGISSMELSPAMARKVGKETSTDCGWSKSSTTVDEKEKQGEDARKATGRTWK